MRSIEQLRIDNASTELANSWDEIGPDDFDPEGDYIIFDHGSVQILTPLSNAGRQWMYRSLPADAPRWGRDGFVVEPRYIGLIINGMEDDGLTPRVLG